MSTLPRKIGAEAIAEKGWLAAHKWLILRRVSQLGILAVFLAGPLLGLWIVKGNLNYSYTLGVLPLADPYVLLQSMLSGMLPEVLAIAGAGIVVVFYMLVGGRAYCAWVCPVNLVADGASLIRRHLGLRGGAHLPRTTRYWMLAMTLTVTVLTGTLAWEMLNPVSMLHRGLIFGMGMGWVVIVAVFLFDLFVVERGWCGHVCPTGAFYSLIGRASMLRMHLPRRDACNNCMDCYAVCPEYQVIKPALKAVDGAPPVILDAQCVNCGRCIDVCSKDVFAFGTRFGLSRNAGAQSQQPIEDARGGVS